MTQVCGLHFTVRITQLSKTTLRVLPEHVFTVAPSMGELLNYFFPLSNKIPLRIKNIYVLGEKCGLQEQIASSIHI